jgi:DnaJ-class molecular chaperone
MKDFYEILELDPQKDQINRELIRQRYLLLVKKYHPDKSSLPKEEAEEKFNELKIAYDFLIQNHQNHLLHTIDNEQRTALMNMYRLFFQLVSKIITKYAQTPEELESMRRDFDELFDLEEIMNEYDYRGENETYRILYNNLLSFTSNYLIKRINSYVKKK